MFYEGKLVKPLDTEQMFVYNRIVHKKQQLRGVNVAAVSYSVQR